MPQLSKEEYQDIKDMAAAAVTVSLFASAFEITLCFVLGKALESMWTVVYAMQFLVYLGMW